MKRKLANFLVTLPRQVKRLISLGFDLSVSLFCTFGFLLIVTNNSKQLFNTQHLSIAALLAALQIGALWFSGTYQTVARFLGLKSLAQSSLYLLSVNAFIFALFSLYGVSSIPNSLGAAQPALFFSFFLGSRFLVAILLANYNSIASIGNTKTQVNLAELAETLTWPGFRKVAGKYWKTGLEELYRSFSKSAFTKALQELIPEIQESDLVAGGAGVRAQACDRSGGLLDDFAIRESEFSINVLNAPSPAATSSLAIGGVVAEMVRKRF